MTVQAHADAMLALARADTGPPTLVVLDGVVPAGQRPPYALVYFVDTDPENSGSRPLTGESRRHRVRAYCHCVGGSAAAARAVAQRIRAAWLDVTPTVAGRTCFPIRREEGQPADRDESTGELVVDQVDVYRLESFPS